MKDPVNLPFTEWIREIVEELGLFDLVEIPPVWDEIIRTLPVYLQGSKSPDLELIWLFEATGDDIPDLFFQISHIKERLFLKILNHNQENLMVTIQWFHELERTLLQRVHEKNVPVSPAKPSVPISEKGNQEEGQNDPWQSVFYNLLDALPLGAIVFNSMGKALFLNFGMEQLTGISQNKLQSVEDIRQLSIDEEQNIKVYKYFQRAVQGEEFTGIPFSLRSETSLPLKFSLHTINCPGDRFLALLLPEIRKDQPVEESSADSVDIQLRNMKEEMTDQRKRYSELKGQLQNSFKIIERVTRLLKEDVDNFHTFTTLLEEDQKQTTNPNQDIETMVQISASLDEMMENLMEFAQLSLKRLHFAPVQWDAELAAEEVFSHLEERIKYSSWSSRSILIENRAQKETTVPLDFRIVTEILWQLLMNAVSFSKGAIHVLAKVEARNLVFSVEDHGEGIYDSDLERVFQPLVRLKPSFSKGLGLGLSIVEQYCDISGYQVALKSLPGKGTIAELRLNHTNGFME